jgi:hypothetical protein
MIFTDIITALVKAKVRFVVVGGVAAGINGSARATFDLDICYDPAPDNVEKLARVLAGWHAYLRGVEPGLPFIMDAKSFRITPVMTLTTDLGPLDVMDRIAGVGDFDKVLANSFEVEQPGLTFRTLTLASLVDAKRATGRKKDRDQLPELEALLAQTRRSSTT